jgi:oligoendopeptidase F
MRPRRSPGGILYDSWDRIQEGHVASTESTLPHWDMSVVFPGIDSPEFEQGFNAVVQEITLLGDLFDRHNIAEREPQPLDEETVEAFDACIRRYNEVLQEASTLSAYLYCFVSTNSRDDLAQARMSELQGAMVRLSQLGTRFTAWLGSLDVEALVARSDAARAHAYALRQAKVEAEHLMSPEEEALSAELNVTGANMSYHARRSRPRARAFACR